MSDERDGIWGAFNNILDYGIAFFAVLFLLSVFLMLCRLAWWLLKIAFVALIFIGKRIPDVLRFVFDLAELVYLAFMASLEYVYFSIRSVYERASK